jgi:hypothetical protein
MAQITIGGTSYEVTELSFEALERCWKWVDEALLTLDPMKAPAAGLRIIASGIMDSENFKPVDFGITEENLGDTEIFERVTTFLKKKLKAREIEQIRVAVIQITEEAGVEITTTGEAPQSPVEEESASQVTVPDTSQSLSQPDAAGGTGSP